MGYLLIISLAYRYIDTIAVPSNIIDLLFQSLIYFEDYGHLV